MSKWVGLVMSVLIDRTIQVGICRVVDSQVAENTGRPDVPFGFESRRHQ